MSQPFRSAPAANNASQGKLVIHQAFDYAALDAVLARQAQKAAQRIQRLLRRTLGNLTAIGTDLLVVKESLPHGSFGPWLRAKFGWDEWTARNFMIVALRFGAKSAIIADLRIDATAAYLLAAPSAPEEACAAALRWAEDVEHIMLSVAEEILSSVRKELTRPRQAS